MGRSTTDASAPELPRPVIMDQFWADLVFLHWRVDSALVAPWMPPGSRPDEHDGSSWVGLIGFEMQDAGFGAAHPVPYLGTFGEINVRLYSTDERGRRGVVFCSLETERLALVAATNPLRVRYRWAWIDIARDGDVLGYRSRRLAPPHRGARTDFAVRRGLEDVGDDPLAVFLTARWCMHHSVLGRGIYVPNTHRAWPLRSAELLHCDDGLLAAAGLPGVAERPPDSVLTSSGVRTQFGRPGRVDGPGAAPHDPDTTTPSTGGAPSPW